MRAPHQAALRYFRDAEAPRISVRAALDEPEFATVVALSGEHDCATREAVRVALEPLRGDVLLCLADCRFIDASVLGVVAGKARELDDDGGHLAVRLDAQAHTVPLILELVAQIEPDEWPIWDIRTTESVPSRCH